MKAVQDDGGDPTTIEFVEVAFPDAQAQLDAGNIDAAWVPDPFMSQIVGAGGTSSCTRTRRRFPGFRCWSTSPRSNCSTPIPSWSSEFAAAMTEALDWASANEDAVRAAIVDEHRDP